MALDSTKPFRDCHLSDRGWLAVARRLYLPQEPLFWSTPMCILAHVGKFGGSAGPMLGLCWTKSLNSGLCSANFNPDLRKIRSGLNRTFFFDMSSLVGLVLCQIGSILGLSWSIWHIHSLATFRHFSPTKIKYDIFHILLAKNEVVQGHCIGRGKPTLDAKNDINIYIYILIYIYLHMYIYIYLCMYSSVLQQWQLICFLDAKPAQDETPKIKHFFHKNKNVKKNTLY